MADTSLTNRKYNMPDGDLIVFANALASVMTRDLTEMAIYGITNDTISDFEDLVNAFQALPSDDLLRADLSYAVEERDNKRNLMMNYMRSIAARSKAIYGENSAKYRSLAPGALSKLSDSNLLLAAGQVHSAATTNLTELAAEGVTALYLTEFQTAINNFEASINDVSDKKNLRDNGTENKISKGNELYALVVKYCDYGKLIWENISPAKYNDYVIYTQSSPGTLTAPGNVVFNGETLTLSWIPVDNAASYQVKYSTDNSNFEELYNGSELSVYFEPLTEGMIYFSVRARNSGGFGPKTILELDYTSVLQPSSGISLTVTNATTHTIALNWSPVNFATSYRLYRSTVTLGADEGAYSLVGEYSGTNYSGAQTTGMRHYFHVVSVNATQTSSPSLPVFVDL